MTYSFDTEIAEMYGVEEAIIYQNIKFWCAKNKANGEKIYRGKAWVYNTLSAWVELFPFWNRDKIFRILKRMELKGLILKDHFSNNPFDRTSYYTDNMQDAFCESTKSDIANMQNVDIANMQNDYKGTVSKHINKPVNKLTDCTDEEFETFYNSYPKKIKKKEALRKWKQNKPPLDQCLRVIEDWKATWAKDNNKYCPNPATWIHQGRWEDSPPEKHIEKSKPDNFKGEVNFDF